MATAIVGVAASLIAPTTRVVHAEPPKESGDFSPKTWVRAKESNPGDYASPVWWWIWAETRDYLGEAEWKSIDVSWMPARARTDMQEATPEWHYHQAYMLAGLWRLELERDAVLKFLWARDDEAAWPLSTPSKRFPLGGMGGDAVLWRPRMERWYRAQPKAEAAENLRAKLAESWQEALASKNVRLAATVAQAMDERLGRESTDALAAEALGLIRETVALWEAQGRKDPRDFSAGRLPIALMERFGVPEPVNLTMLIDPARRQEESLGREPIPLPHPYDLRLQNLRLQRLLKRK